MLNNPQVTDRIAYATTLLPLIHILYISLSQKRCQMLVESILIYTYAHPHINYRTTVLKKVFGSEEGVHQLKYLTVEDSCS